jgi:hypothetical protein
VCGYLPPIEDFVRGHSVTHTSEQSREREPPMTRALRSYVFGGGPVTASVRRLRIRRCMQKRVFRNKQFVVDSQRYEASLTALYADAIHLRLTIRADFGYRSFCTFNGLQNFDYYHNYGQWDAIESVAITPRMISALIRYARRKGWDPESCKSNQQISLTNQDADSLRDDYNTDIDSAAETIFARDLKQIATNNPMNPSGGSGAS